MSPCGQTGRGLFDRLFTSQVDRSHIQCLDEKMSSDEWFSLLRCPRCRGELDLQNAQEKLICLTCQVAYDVKQGIPSLLAEEARPLP